MFLVKLTCVRKILLVCQLFDTVYRVAIFTWELEILAFQFWMPLIDWHYLAAIHTIYVNTKCLCLIF